MSRLCLALLSAAVFGSSVVLFATAEAQTIRIDGSSTVHPISREAAQRFERRNGDADIEVDFSGTTAGFEAFCAGELEIADASRPINAEELAACAENEVAFIELPIAVDAITIVVNAENDWVEMISVDQLRLMWEPAAEGVITTWSDVRDGWPDEPLVLFGRGQDSGTYDYFTGAVVGTVRESRKDYEASEDISFLVQGIAEDPNALGFFGIGGYFANYEILRDVAVDSGDGPVHASLEAVQAGDYRPLTRPLFIYVNAAAAEANPTLVDFVEFYLNSVSLWVAFTGYMPLDDASYVTAIDHFENRRTGSAYDGEMRYDMTIPDILERQTATQ